MRILFINEKCGYLGGVEQNVADSARGLRARGHRCGLCYGSLTGKDPDGYRSLFDETYACSDFAFGSGGAAGEPFDAILEKASPDVAYFHKVPETSFWERSGGSVRSVRMVHDHDLCCPRGYKYFTLSGRLCHFRAGWRCWTDLAFIRRDRSSPIGVGLSSIGKKMKEMRRNQRLDRLLVGSRFMRETLLQNGFAGSKIHLLPPVVQNGLRGPTRIPDDPHILYVGQLIHGKGVDLLLRALAMIETPFRATVVGTGNASERLEALSARMGLSDRVRFEGWVGHEGLRNYYDSARVVAVPSRWPEPFGLVGLEAMGHGRPVVAFDVGGIPDWLEDGVTGLLVAEQDTGAYARALERVLTDGDLAERLGQRGYERARERYSFDRYIDELERHLSAGEVRSESS